jgi:hypothetical protein
MIGAAIWPVSKQLQEIKYVNDDVAPRYLDIACHRTVQ